MKRTETRRERYENKMTTARHMPVSVATINFMHDDNFAFVVRAAAAFGARDVHCIGSLPNNKTLKAKSGGLSQFTKIHQHKSPHSFLEFMQQTDTRIITAELTEGAISIYEYEYNFDTPLCIVVGHEETGVPVEIMKNSDTVYIPMPGVGYCLNTSQTANIMLFEVTRQYDWSQN